MQRVLGPLLKEKVELLFYGERSFEETLTAVASLPPHSAIFFQQLNVDGTGAVYGDKEPLNRIYNERKSKGRCPPRHPIPCGDSPWQFGGTRSHGP